MDGLKASTDCGDEVMVRRARAEHQDGAIGAFLSLIEADIRAARRVGFVARCARKSAGGESPAHKRLG